MDVPIIPPRLSFPPLPVSFGVVVDTDDFEWEQDKFVCSIGRMLLDAGARYFLCFGRNARPIHDRFDDIIIEQGFIGLTTSCHDHESEFDVACVVKSVVLYVTKGVLVIAREQQRWETAFADLE